MYIAAKYEEKMIENVLLISMRYSTGIITELIINLILHLALGETSCMSQSHYYTVFIKM